MMTVYYNENAKAYNGFEREEILEYASMASNEANKDDPIDSAVLRAYQQSKQAATVEAACEARKRHFTLEPEGFVGFNAVVKRTCARMVKSDGTKIFVSKGMVDVILKTDPADEGIQWEVENHHHQSAECKQHDADLG